ncbi:MAG: histidine phosphatase family protein [Hyphomonadaceae bacterium]|nr:histidine phosphatase family protein [Hyphomonadaceae bacterium]
MDRAEQTTTPGGEGGRGDKPGWVVIVRHGKPVGDRKARVTWREYIEWWKGYDASGLVDGETPPPALRALADEADLIFSSTLRRACETAAAIAGDRAVIHDPVFIEAPLPPPPIMGRRKPRRWGVYARIYWWLGGSRGGETRREAEQRAEAAAATLAAHALRGQNVIVCAHGWFNRMMRPVLLSWGWKCVFDGGDKYWSYRKYVRRL